VVAASRATLPASFSAHQSEFAAGKVACCGQECQKHPSTNTATLARVNATSMVRRFMPGTGRPTR
jgi:hypothetical protein